MTPPKTVRIATRESQLALTQTKMVAAALREEYPGLQVELVGMTTQGDRVLDRPLSQVGGKGLFIKELEVALDAGRADLAVHSMKDVPMEVEARFALSTFGPREVPLDAFVSNRFAALEELPDGARVGTSSLRRECQLRNRHPRLDFRPLRGNVNTRLAKLDAGEYEAIILAAAGLRRLGFKDRIRATLADSIPAICQGILAVEHLAAREDLGALVAPFVKLATAQAARAERALGRIVEGSCEVPLGAFASVTRGELALEAFVGRPDGTHVIRNRIAGPAADAQSLGERLGEALLAAGGREILAALAAPKAAP